jgi:hypothetical protein
MEAQQVVVSRESSERRACAGEPGDPAEPMTSDIPALSAASRRAIEQFDRATASGNPSAIGAAKVELRVLM